MKMKTKVTLMILVAFLLTSCAHLRNHSTDKTHPPVKLSLDNALNIQIVNGIAAVVDKTGKVISKRVKPPIKLTSEKEQFRAKSIERIQEISIITIKGSCLILIKVGNQYTQAYLPDGHPLCPPG